MFGGEENFSSTSPRNETEFRYHLLYKLWLLIQVTAIAFHASIQQQFSHSVNFQSEADFRENIHYSSSQTIFR